MSESIHAIGDSFWNFRGSFKIAKVIDVGTQASLVKLGSGKFVFLDSYTLGTQARKRVDELTREGEDLEAILNLHPFHTVHVKNVHRLYPQARLYGTARHTSRFPDLPWGKLHTEDSALHELYADDFEFSVPEGVDFISADENVHFSSVLACHRATQTLHVDDTLTHMRLPMPMRLIGMTDPVSFHLTLAKALKPHAGAAGEFRVWASEMIERWKKAQNLCAAHTSALLAENNQGESIELRLLAALKKAEPVLQAHEKKHG